MIGQYVALASYTVLLWDHAVTFGDEVRYIWRRRKGPLIWLFLLNRYLTPLSFIVNLFAYFSEIWTPEKFVRYEGSMTVIGINTSALMMLLRIYAMYEKNIKVVVLVAATFTVELGMNAWLLTKGIVTACTMIFDITDVPSVVVASSAWLPLLYDTIVLALTVKRSFSTARHPSIGRTMRILLKEGIWYYSVIFCITLILTVMIVSAPDGLKNVTAHMTVAMMSRITLHLKKEAHRPSDNLGAHDTYELRSVVHASSGSVGTSAINFAHVNRRNNLAAAQMTISVQECFVTHDDHGREVAMPQSLKKVAQVNHHERKSWEGDEEWIELTGMPISRT
ncbi:hypothetical protein C8Q76DRAFT_772249 [Earliella scabrosa]|nr:hypothetical protein C8Q76DRAFT_772249 [Earliella scabrosa]